VQLFIVYHAKAGRAVRFSLFHDPQELVILFIGISDQDFAAPLEGKSEFFGELPHHFIALYTQACFQGPGIVRKSAVADTCIPGTCLEADVEVFLQNGYIQFVAGQLTGDGASYHTGTDYDDIV
jgi:hypothetical protein